MIVTPRDLARRFAEQVLTWEATAGFAMEYPREVLSALIDLGAMSPQERVEWTARWDHASLPAGTPPEEIATRAQALIERAFERQSDPRPADPTERRNQLFATLQTLQRAGALTLAEHSLWQQRLDREFPAEPPPPAPYLARRQRGVVLGSDLRLGGLRITSVELFDDCVIVRWHLLVDDYKDDRESVHIHDRTIDLANAFGPTRIDDDTGTAYTAIPTRSYHLDTRWVYDTPLVLPGASAFVPGIPAQATSLLVACAAGEFKIDI